MQNLNTAPALEEQLAERKSKIEAIDQKIEALTAEHAELEEKYPEIFKPFPLEAIGNLTRAESSDWMNDDVEVTYDEARNAYEMQNISKVERLTESINYTKQEAGELAFKLIAVSEHDQSDNRAKITEQILDRKKEVGELEKGIKDIDATSVHSSWTDYKTSIQNPNGALIGSIAMLKPEDLYGKRMKFSEILAELKEKTKPTLDDGSIDLIQKKSQDIAEQLFALKDEKEKL